MNIKGHCSYLNFTGYANHSRNFFRALSKLYPGLFVRNYTVCDRWREYINDDDKKILSERTLISSDGKFVIRPMEWNNEILDKNPDEEKIHIILQMVEHHYHYDKYNGKRIAYIAWETTRFPNGFFDHILQFEQLWVPSNWQRNCAINQGYPIERVFVVPEAVDEDVINYKIEKKENDKFRFVLVGKWEKRKSTEEIVRAFLNEFKASENVELVVCANNLVAGDKIFNCSDKLKSLGIQDDRIKPVGFLSRQDHIKLLASADCFVSCSRGEGWNLPLCNAMALGVPSIFSNYGGQTEFTKNFPLNVPILGEEKAEVELNIDGLWGVPDFSRLSERMREAYEDKENQKRLAKKLSHELKRKFTWKKSALIVKKILDKINAGFTKENITNIIGGKEIYYKIHSSSVGDAICATPTLKILSNTYNKKINVITKVKEVFKNNPYVNNLYDFNDNKAINGETFESFVLAGKSNQFGIERKFSRTDLRQTHANDLGFQLYPDEMSCEFYPDDKLTLDIELSESYFVLHVTKNWPNRTWDNNNWNKLINYLESKNVPIVLIGKDGEEKKCEFFNAKGLNLINQGNLSDMWHIINRAKCIVTMDTGPLHIAGTTDTFIIQLGSAKDHRFSAPYRKGSQNYKYLYIEGNCNLYCTSNLKYSIKEWNTIKSIPVLIGCQENKPIFECHPSAEKVIQNIEYLFSIGILK